MLCTLVLIQKMEAALLVIKRLSTSAEKMLAALKENSLKDLNQEIYNQSILLKEFSLKENDLLLEQKKLMETKGIKNFVENEIRLKINSLEADKLIDLKGKLSEGVRSLKNTQELTQLILKQNLAYTKHMVKLFDQLGKENKVYSQSGEVGKSSGNSILNQRV